jgi:hypothetical protein
MSGCNNPAQDHKPSPVIEAYVSDSGAVGFDISPLPLNNGTTSWICTYSGRGKTANFVIEFGSSTPAKSDIPMAFGKGRFVAVQGSDASSLLQALKTSLEAKKLPRNPARLKSVPFTYVNLGENMSRDANGFGNKPGHWTAMKLFFNDAGDNESEVFFNLNPVIRKAEFSIKDEDYGDQVMAELAKVL